MTPKEQARLQVLNSLLAEHMTLDQAAELMSVSTRHARRITTAYREEGAAALAHGHRGRKPANATPEAVIADVVHLAGTRYQGANHTHLSELLAEREGIDIGRTTLRRILLDALAALGLRRARVTTLIMWRSGLRISETIALEWRDVDVQGGTLLVRRGKGGKGRTVPLHPDLASLFANWPTPYGPRDAIVGLTRKTALRHLRAGIEHAGLDEESPGTGRQKAGAHSLRHSAARHWLTTAAVPLNVVSAWLGHANPEVTLRIYLPIVGSTHTMADVP